MEPIQSIASNRDGMRLRGMVASMICLTFMSAAPVLAFDAKDRAQSHYGKLPFSFEANQGQTDAQVRFLTRGQGYALFMTPTEAVLSLKKSQDQIRDTSLAKFSHSREETGTVLRMQFVEANFTPQILGKEKLPGKVNYLIGNDSSEWHTGMPTYAKVSYEDLYPGIDLVFYGNQGQLEYDFVVAPGGDPGQIKLAFKGANKIEINRAGDLVLHMASGEIRLHKPVIYQEIGGARKSIKGGFVLKDSQTVGFQVAANDASHPLIIDPVLVYSTYLGGSDFDDGRSIAVDERGRAYLTGETNSPDFPVDSALQPTFGGGSAQVGDAFVVQLTADGGAVLYATYLGGRGEDSGAGIAVDRRGRAYVTGWTNSRDFPSVNALQPKFGGGAAQVRDAFVAQLTADGSALRYSTYLGGSDFDDGRGIAVDKQGQAYVTGGTVSSDFPTMNALQPKSGGGTDVFVAQFTADGRALRYATYLGGSGGEGGSSIAVDGQGQAYVTGSTSSSDFPIMNALQPVLGDNNVPFGGRDAFVAKLTKDGAALRYATYLGGISADDGRSIAVDRLGQAYVTGRTGSSDFPTVNPLQAIYGGDTDAFVAQFTINGDALRYSTFLGGSDTEDVRGIAVDSRGRASVTGGTFSTDFPTENALQPFLAGRDDAFVAQLTVDGGALQYSTYLGGDDIDIGYGIAVDRWGQVYVTGVTGSLNFPTENALQSAPGGFFDAFVTKIGSDGSKL
ncbi:SBBP repeat-containing protein [Methylobacter sp. BlB1]|uniref:DUF7948 domain-containing protein n=1 Tax=Methylobacter sp. BlB1 TaxID=2785914 RepID=UPI0018938714|nr:SBBP repeat-containing protein [Methylobacter sp. BlB1]MBF6651120.1 SBBP repeat-containing protein [Methylobacter sp. BlB1]